MSNSLQADILRRKLRPAQTRRVQDGAGDIWRRILPRLAADAMGLELAVSGFAERTLDLHEDLSVEDGALLLLLVGHDGAPGGLAIVDPALLAALIEVQTTGSVTSGRRDPRRPTAVDAALSRHVIDGWMAGVAEASGDGYWPVTGAFLPDLRTALLKLEEGRWTETRVDLDLGGGKRSGRLLVFRPVRQTQHRAAEPDGMCAMLMPVETALDAVLCRLRLPLGSVASLARGQLVPLPDVSLRRVRLEAPLGRLVAQVHLGQSRGFRAVRVLPAHAADGTGVEPRDTGVPERGIDVHDLLPGPASEGGEDPGLSLPLPET